MCRQFGSIGDHTLYILFCPYSDRLFALPTVFQGQHLMITRFGCSLLVALCWAEGPSYSWTCGETVLIRWLLSPAVLLTVWPVNELMFFVWGSSFFPPKGHNKHIQTLFTRNLCLLCCFVVDCETWIRAGCVAFGLFWVFAVIKHVYSSTCPRKSKFSQVWSKKKKGLYFLSIF